MSKPTVAIVIPNHLDNIDFLDAWQEEFSHCWVIVMQDADVTPKYKLRANLSVYSHADVARDLGENAWIIPKRTSACRSYGYFKAWETGADYIITIDNDCFPEPDKHAYVVDGHISNLTSYTTLDWTTNSPEHYPIWTRGFPYLIRHKSPVYLSHGLWSKVPDLDAATWLQQLDISWPPTNTTMTIPRYTFTPMCGMNLAWRRELTPAMWFGLFGPDYGFDQYDDIWAGVLVKRVLDHLGYAMVSGYPSVEHRKQSNVFVNLKKQAPGLAMNEHFYTYVRDAKLTATNVIEAYQELIAQLPDTMDDEPQEGYLKQFKRAAIIWTTLFQTSK